MSASPRGRARAARWGGRGPLLPPPGPSPGSLGPRPRVPSPGSPSPGPRRLFRGSRAGAGRGKSRLITGLGLPRPCRSRAGRARSSGGRPRTHITGRGPGPHPGSPGADRRGAGRCRPTRSRPAKRSSPWRRLTDALLTRSRIGPAPPRWLQRLPGSCQRAAGGVEELTEAGGGLSKPRPGPAPCPPVRSVTPVSTAGRVCEDLRGPRSGLGTRCSVTRVLSSAPRPPAGKPSCCASWLSLACPAQCPLPSPGKGEKGRKGLKLNTAPL